MNAVPIVSSLPCATYAKKDVTETRIGAHVQINEKQIELMRAVQDLQHLYACTLFGHI